MDGDKPSSLRNVYGSDTASPAGARSLIGFWWYNLSQQLEETVNENREQQGGLEREWPWSVGRSGGGKIWQGDSIVKNTKSQNQITQSTRQWMFMTIRGKARRSNQTIFPEKLEISGFEWEVIGDEGTFTGKLFRTRNGVLDTGTHRNRCARASSLS